MKIAFKVSNNGPDAPKVSHTNFREHFAGINLNTDWSTLLPTIRKVTNEVVIPRTGKELYTDLVNKYHDGTALDEDETDVLELIQDLVANWTMISLPSELLISVSNMGVVEKGSSQAPVNPVAQWRYKEFKYQRTLEADRLLDRLIQKLDQLVLAGVAYFDLYKTSEAFTQNKTSFFDGAKTFSKYVRINESRRLFDALIPYIERAEEDVDKIVCEDQFNQLVELLNEPEELAPGEETALTDSIKTLIEKIRRYVAAKAIATGAPGLYVTLDVNGLSLSSYTDGFSNFNHHSGAFKGAEAVGAYVSRHAADAEIFFSDLSNFINDNIDDLPLIKNSDCYAAYTTLSKRPIERGPGGVWF